MAKEELLPDICTDKEIIAQSRTLTDNNKHIGKLITETKHLIVPELCYALPSPSWTHKNTHT